jgi:hypothetical protein
MIRKRTDQTDSRVRGTRGDDGKVGIIGFISVGQAIQAAAQTDDLATFPQGVQSVGMHALCNQITGSQRTAPIAKSLKCSVEITRFHGG